MFTDQEIGSYILPHSQHKTKKHGKRRVFLLYTLCLMHIVSLFTLKSFIFCLLVAVNILLFLGIFMAEGSYHEYSDTHHYNMNRGLFVSWAGVSAIDKPVPFPLIKVPFLQNEKYKVDKTIDVSIFGKYVLIFFSFPFLFLTFFGLLNNKRSVEFEKTLTFFILLLVISTFYLYFFWFPRV